MINGLSDIGEKVPELARQYIYGLIPGTFYPPYLQNHRARKDRWRKRSPGHLCDPRGRSRRPPCKSPTWPRDRETGDPTTTPALRRRTSLRSPMIRITLGWRGRRGGTGRLIQVKFGFIKCVHFETEGWKEKWGLSGPTMPDQEWVSCRC